MVSENSSLLHHHRSLSRRASSRRGEVSFKDDHIDMDGSFKAAVFGFNDGLCANTCLMIGIGSASGITPGAVIASGLVGLVAGAASMGAGEWISGTLSNDQERHEIERERDHIRHHEDAEDRNMAKLLRDEYGFSQKTIDSVFDDLKTGDRERDFENKLRLNVKLEMGLDVGEESSNPIKAMLFMMLAFTLGALVPLIPWVPLWYPGPVLAMWLSVLSALIASFTVGARLAFETGEPVLTTAFRQVWAATVAIVSVWGVGALYQILTGQEPPAA